MGHRPCGSHRSSPTEAGLRYSFSRDEPENHHDAKDVNDDSEEHISEKTTLNMVTHPPFLPASPGQGPVGIDCNKSCQTGELSLFMHFHIKGVGSFGTTHEASSLLSVLDSLTTVFVTATPPPNSLS